MRKIVALGFAVMLAAGSSTALADTMEQTYGNTVLSTNDKGETTTLWFKADGTYTGQTAKGEKFSGKWAIRDGKYCSTPDAAPDAPAGTPAPEETCIEYQANHNVGDKWSQNDADGKPITVEIKAGM